MPGKSVCADDLMATCLNAGKDRVLRYSRPRQMSMDKTFVGSLLQQFNGSGLCPTGRHPEIPKRRISNCKRWYHLIEVPLRSGVSETEAFTVGSLVIRRVFLSLQIEAARARSGPQRDRRPYRVYAPARTAGSIGTA